MGKSSEVDGVSISENWPPSVSLMEEIAFVTSLAHADGNRFYFLVQREKQRRLECGASRLDSYRHLPFEITLSLSAVHAHRNTGARSLGVSDSHSEPYQDTPDSPLPCKNTHPEYAEAIHDQSRFETSESSVSMPSVSQKSTDQR
jgi:hypothetical protein